MRSTGELLSANPGATRILKVPLAGYLHHNVHYIKEIAKFVGPVIQQF
jgi:hypothetical protein